MALAPRIAIHAPTDLHQTTATTAGFVLKALSVLTLATSYLQALTEENGHAKNGEKQETHETVTTAQDLKQLSMQHSVHDLQDQLKQASSQCPRCEAEQAKLRHFPNHPQKHSRHPATCWERNSPWIGHPAWEWDAPTCACKSWRRSGTGHS